MIYIYDILLNFCDSNLIYDFYEWDNNDDIENIKRIKLLHIDRCVFDDLLNYDIKIDIDFLLKIYRTSEVYDKKSVRILDYSCLFSDGDRVIAIEFDKEGNSIYKSKLLLDEETEIALLASNLEVFNINYQKNNKILDNRFITRKEILIRNYLFKEIESAYHNKNYGKLKYLYQECFDKDNMSYSEIKKELINDIDSGINDKHKELYNLLKLTHKKKQV